MLCARHKWQASHSLTNCRLSSVKHWILLGVNSTLCFSLKALLSWIDGWCHWCGINYEVTCNCLIFEYHHVKDYHNLCDSSFTTHVVMYGVILKTHGFAWHNKSTDLTFYHFFHRALLGSKILFVTCTFVWLKISRSRGGVKIAQNHPCAHHNKSLQVRRCLTGKPVRQI